MPSPSPALRITRLRLAIGALLAVALLSLAGAGTASAVVPGGLQNVACLTSGTVAPCTTVANLTGSSDVVVAPDGRHVYVATSLAIFAFDRDGAGGRLTFRQCINTSGTGGCDDLPVSSVSAASAIEITPDGNHVYVANAGTDAILEFTRNGNGSLTQKAAAPCIDDNGGPAEECADAQAMDNPVDLAVAGDTLYVASSTSDGVTALKLGAGGGLSQATAADGAVGCVQQVNNDNCGEGRGLDGAHALEARGNAVYVAASTGRSLAVLKRDQGSGLLSVSGAASACLENVNTTNCTTVPELNTAAGINDIAVGGGGQLYVTLLAGANAPARVLTFQPQGEGLVRGANAAGCVINGAATATCAEGRGMLAPAGIVASADGADVYVAGGPNGAVVELNRDGNGALTERNELRGCIAESAGGFAPCTTLTTLVDPAGIAVAPDGRHVYVTSSSTGRVTTLRRDSSGPVCSNPSVTVQHGSVGPLPLACADPDGDTLTFTLVNPPTLGSLGALDNAARTIVYAAPQGQNGTASFTYRARYTSAGTFEEVGTTTVNVEGAPNAAPAPPVVVPAGVDGDRDGFFAGQDCNDRSAAIRPGALEVKGNRVDENCDGLAEPFPTLASGILTSWTSRGARLTLKALRITQQFPRGLKVEISCRPKCTFKTKPLKLAKLRRGARSVISSLSRRQRVFRSGQTVEVRVSAPGFNTKVSRYVLRRGDIPSAQPFCVIPGERTPRKVCS